MLQSRYVLWDRLMMDPHMELLVAASVIISLEKAYSTRGAPSFWGSSDEGRDEIYLYFYSRQWNAIFSKT